MNLRSQRIQDSQLETASKNDMYKMVTLNVTNSKDSAEQTMNVLDKQLQLLRQLPKSNLLMMESMAMIVADVQQSIHYYSNQHSRVNESNCSEMIHLVARF